MALPHARLCLLLALAPLAGTRADAPHLAIQHVTLVTEDLASDACTRATAPALTVIADTVVQYCFGVRNVGNVTLVAHDVVTDDFGPLYGNEPLTVAPGATAWLTHLEFASSDRTLTSTWAARDVTPVYTPAPAAYDFVDIRGTGQKLDLNWWQAAPVTLPFDVSLYGTTSPQLSICAFGLVSVASTATRCALPYDVGLPTAAAPYSLMPFWDLLVHVDGGDGYTGVWWQVDGSAPHRRAIVQWQGDHQHALSEGPGDGNGVSFEVVLHEGDPGFEYQYLDTSFGRPNHRGDNGSEAIVAVNAGGTLAQVYSSHAPNVTAPFALRWTPNSWNTVTATNSATVLARAPRIDVAGPISGAQAPNTVVAHDVTVGNGGDYVLDWHAGAAAANSTAHIPRQPRPVSNAWHAPLRPRAGTDPPVPPLAYGRMTNNSDFNDEAFISIDLPSGHVTKISDVQTTPIGPVQFGDGGRLYAMSGSDRFVTVNPADGVYSFVANVDTHVREDRNLLVAGFAYDATTGVTYLVANDYDNEEFDCGPDAWLFRLHADTGVAHPVGRIASNVCVGDIAINANGEMFGVDTKANTLLAIDKTTGAGTVVGPLGYDVGFTPGIGLDFDLAHDVLWLAAWNNAIWPGAETRTIDTVTGASTKVAMINGSHNPDAQVTSIAIRNPLGGCVDPATVGWVSMTPASGQVNPGHTQTISVRTDATGLAPGHYGALLCVYSNDPTRRFAPLPVEMDVLDGIFANGFEGAAR